MAGKKHDEQNKHQNDLQTCRQTVKHCFGRISSANTALLFFNLLVGHELYREIEIGKAILYNLRPLDARDHHFCATTELGIQVQNIQDFHLLLNLLKFQDIQVL